MPIKTGVAQLTLRYSARSDLLIRVCREVTLLSGFYTMKYSTSGIHSTYSTGCTFFASPVSTLISTSVSTPRQIAAAMSPVKVPNRIITKGPKQLLKSEKSSFVKPDSMEKPTKISATPVTAVGIIKNSGDRKMHTRNSTQLTIADRPGRPPASTPMVD